MSIWTDHPGETENPQTYWRHGQVALGNSLKLIAAGLAGVVHAVFPFLFPFYTSTRIIRAFKLLVDSERHKHELRRELPQGYLLPVHLRDGRATAEDGRIPEAYASTRNLAP